MLLLLLIQKRYYLHEDVLDRVQDLQAVQPHSFHRFKQPRVWVSRHIGTLVLEVVNELVVDARVHHLALLGDDLHYARMNK